MKTHVKKEHASETALACTLCAYAPVSTSDLDQHLIEQHVRSNPQVKVNTVDTFRCALCEFIAIEQEILENHVKNTHEASTLLQCEFCPFKCKNHIQLRKHSATYHAKSRCNKCNFTSSSQFHLFLHQENEHKDIEPTIPPSLTCDLCGLTFFDTEELDSHIRRRHTHYEPDANVSQPSQSIPNNSLSIIREEQIDMAQTLKTMQDTILAQLSEIQKNQNVFRDLLNHLSHAQNQQGLSLDILHSAQNKLQEQVKEVSDTVSQKDKQKEPPNLLPNNLEEPERVSALSTSLLTPQPCFQAQPPTRSSLSAQTSTYPQSIPSSKSHPSSMIPETPTQSCSEPRNHPSKPSIRIPTSRRHKVLLIADSIGSNVDIRHLEEATNTLIYKERAFGASFKPDALRPYENFNCVSLTAPTKRNYSYAVLQGSSTDITNLDTSFSPEANIHFLKQEVFLASQNMITAARNIILANPNIKKVLILERIPRFDPVSSDPKQMKHELSNYANKVLREELEKCDLKSKISLGTHSLPSVLQPNLYGPPTDPHYDGVHLRGPDGRNHYTRSVCNILQNFLVSHSREPHNHVIPRISRDAHPQAISKTIPSANKINKPDHVIIDIDIESENLKNGGADTYYSYTITTYNPFSVLEN